MGKGFGILQIVVASWRTLNAVVMMRDDVDVGGVLWCSVGVGLLYEYRLVIV